MFYSEPVFSTPQRSPASRILSFALLGAALGVAALSSACGGATSENAAPAPACSPAGTALHIMTPAEKTHTFAADCLAAPANTPFTIEYTNKDRSSHGQHNLEINDGGKTLFEGRTIGQGRTITYQVPALPAGSYTFLCTTHAFMTGDFIVG